VAASFGSFPEFRFDFRELPRRALLFALPLLLFFLVFLLAMTAGIVL